VYREADSRRAEILSRSEEQAKALDSSVRDAERHIREFFDQTKLIDRADELKVDMERRIEDLRGDIDRLDQRRSEAAQLESEFVKIRRLEDEVNAKMTRFLTEKYRMDKMEEDLPGSSKPIKRCRKSSFSLPIPTTSSRRCRSKSAK
jgi:DNA repair exonuclease SbcCD ATPase subunit